MPTLLTKVADETVAAGNHATGNEEETTSKRKQDSPVVSPGKKKQKADGQETIDKYYERELNATKYLKNLEVLSTKNLLKEDPVVVTVRDVGYGLWSFIQINKFGTNDEPNTIQCLYHALGLVSYTKTKRSPGEMDFAKEVNIFYAAPRRLSREKDQPIFKQSRGNQTALEKEAEFVCSKIKTNELKRAKLERIADYLNFRGINAIVPSNFDQTDKNKQTLDHYITTPSIILLLQHHWNGDVDPTWYGKFPEAASAIFTAPYPRLACKMLGYPYVKMEARTEPVESEEQEQFSDDESI